MADGSNKINKSKRVTIQIPEGTEAYNFLFVENEKTRLAKYEILNEILKQLPKTREDRALSVFNEFITKITEIYPDKRAPIELLRPLILKKILSGGQLEDWYYEELKKI